MAPDRSGSSKRSWKQGSAPVARKQSRGWQRDRAEPRPAEGSSRPAKLLRAGLLLLGCVAAIIGLLYLIWPPHPARLVLVGADYVENLAIPPNLAGWRAIRDLKQLSDREVGFPLWKSHPLRLQDDPVPLAAVTDWSRVENILKKPFRERTLILVLAAHGGSDAQGGYVLPDVDFLRRPSEGEEVPASEYRLRLSTVVQALKAKEIANKNKVLILDGTQLADHWPLGMLHNDFARTLEALQPDLARIPNLWILSASGPDERSWSYDDAAQSVFAHFVVEGLTGAATGRDNRVNLQELVDYVRKNVQEWVATHRGAVQVPVLLATDRRTLARAARSS